MPIRTLRLELNRFSPPSDSMIVAEVYGTGVGQVQIGKACQAGAWVPPHSGIEHLAGQNLTAHHAGMEERP